MDIEEWEILPDDGFLDFHEDGERKTLLGKRNPNPKSVFNMNYFMFPSPNSEKIIEPSRGNSRVVPNQLVPVPFELDPKIGRVLEDEVVKEITKSPIGITIVTPSITEKIKAPNIGSMGADQDQDSVSQVFFKKVKENEFVDMKMDSPKSNSRGFVPQIDAGTFSFGDKGETLEDKSSPKKKREKENMDCDDQKEEVTWEENSGGLNLWKWSLTGIGAICSFGVAAATICVIILGSHHRDKQNQKLRFQIYADDKRIKQVVHHATKLNEAISAARGVPITRAHITFGGYYDAL